MSYNRDAAPGCRLHIGNIPFEMDKNALRALFGKAGKVVDVFTPFNYSKDGYQNRGYAFVEMESDKSANKAIEMFDGYQIQEHRVLSVKHAKPRTPENVQITVHSKIPANCTA